MITLKQKLNYKRPLGVYYQSWSSNWASLPESLDLSKISFPTNIVYLSFVNPSCNYISGSNTLNGTGLDFSSDFKVVKGSINILQKKGIIVILSVGGATYSWKTYNSTSLASLVNDLGCDGLDIDWEDQAGAAASSKLGPIILSLRKALPNKFLCLAGFSVGAYGQGPYTNATPNSQNTGMCIDALKSAGSLLDWINIMSYDASNTYDPCMAFDAYRSYFKGPLLLGAEVPPEAWGGHVITLKEIEIYSKKVLSDSQWNGIFVWSLQKPGIPSCSDIIKTVDNIFQGSIPIPPTPSSTPPPTNVLDSNWVLGTNYSIGDKVIYQNTNYICNISNSSTTLNAPGIQIWTPVPSSVPIATPIPLPSPMSINEWSSGRIYSIGQQVLYTGKIYKCLQSHTSQIGWEPMYVPALWE
jgi:chitinase